MKYVLCFLILCAFFKTLLDVIDEIRRPGYYKKLKMYTGAVTELVDRLEIVINKLPIGTNVSKHEPIMNLTATILMHSVPSRKELRNKSPVTLFYEYFGECIEQIRSYEGWTDNPIINDWSKSK